MTGFEFALTCPSCGAEVEVVTVGRVCAGTETRAVVRCTECDPRSAEYVVELYMRPLAERTTGPLGPRPAAADVRRVAPSAALSAVAEWFGMTAETLTGETRAVHLTPARRVAMLVLRGRGLSLPSIGAEMGRDHTTVRHHLERATAQERADAEAVLAMLASGRGSWHDGWREPEGKRG